jgi:hypothetical protein
LEPFTSPRWEKITCVFSGRSPLSEMRNWFRSSSYSFGRGGGNGFALSGSPSAKS